MNRRARNVLLLDAVAASLAGLTMLVLRDALARLHAFAPALVLFFALSNLTYATYSGSLAARATWGEGPSRRAVDLLIGANLGWVLVCALVVALTWSSATAFGLGHIAGEGLFVGTLALVERRSVRPFAR